MSSVFVLKMTRKVLFLVLIFATIFSEGAKILGIFHRPSKSHHSLAGTLFKALANRGHEVTMLSPFPLEKPVKNYEDIVLTGFDEFNEETGIMKKYIQLQNASMSENIEYAGKMMDRVNYKFLNHPAVKELLASNRTYDLVIQVWAGNPAFLGIPHHFGASVIAFSTIGSNFLTNAITQNPAPYSYISNMFPLYPDEMTFFQRTINTLSHVIFDWIFNYRGMAKQEELRQKYFPKAPTTKELVSNISLVFLNTHYSIESPRPYVPSVIQIGGLHVQEPKELKGDLKDFMDNAVEGVIFFSLGSNVKISDLPKDKLEAIVGTFKKIPLKILWKFDTDDVPNLSPNVKIGKWLPQSDILGHPNMKLFVTHGGLLSTIEAIYHGVPMVGIPVFGDQYTNVDDAVNKGYAVKIKFQDVSQETLIKAINEGLNNPKYRENIGIRSKVLKDQPLKPLDKAVYWVEYVLRHKGAHHLKTSALKLEWYQYYLLDVLAFLGGVLLITSVGFYLFFCLLFRLSKKMLRKIITNISKDVSSENKKK